MYLVVFRNRKRKDIDQAKYEAEAMQMLDLASQQPGFISFKGYVSDDDEVIALSEWENQAAARAWGKVAEHRVAQANGRSDYYASYTLFGCDNPRVHEFKAKE